MDMTPNQLVLWQKIKNFQFDNENINLTFAKRFARENNFTDSFAIEIIEEYKRFVFLCCISDHPLTPSHYVDLAWHLHLTYTKSYWIELCQNTIKKNLHHNPTEGGEYEDNKFRNYYNETLSLYKSKFLENPSIIIWENDRKRFENKIKQIDISKNWIIPKPIFNLSHNFVLIVLFGLLFVSCDVDNGVVIPILFFFIVAGVIIYGIYNSSNNDKNNSSYNGCGTSSDSNNSYWDGNFGGSDNGGSDNGGDGGSGCSSGSSGGD
jgi:hypothetical protein